MRPIAYCLSLFVLVLGCGGATPPPDVRLVLLYAPCTVNASYLGPYDRGLSYTPHLTRFAERSLVFERHQTESGQSGIAYASLFAGVHRPR